MQLAPTVFGCSILVTEGPAAGGTLAQWLQAVKRQRQQATAGGARGQGGRRRTHRRAKRRRGSDESDGGDEDGAEGSGSELEWSPGEGSSEECEEEDMEESEEEGCGDGGLAWQAAHRGLLLQHVHSGDESAAVAGPALPQPPVRLLLQAPQVTQAKILTVAPQPVAANGDMGSAQPAAGKQDMSGHSKAAAAAADTLCTLSRATTEGSGDLRQAHKLNAAKSGLCQMLRLSGCSFAREVQLLECFTSHMSEEQRTRFMSTSYATAQAHIAEGQYAHALACLEGALRVFMP